MNSPNRRTNHLGIIAILVLFVIGCGGGRGILHEQRYKKRLELRKDQEMLLYEFQFDPPRLALEQEGVEIEIEPVTRNFLDGLFNDKRIFGSLAGLNPYIPQAAVFYVKISNKSDKKIWVEPGQFVLLDDANGQYSFLSPDYIVQLSLAKAGATQMVKTTAGAAPGFYGAGLGFATAFTGDPEKRRLSLLNHVTLTGGYIHPGVIYDGYVAFLKPSYEAKKISLIAPNVKFNFNPNDEAQAAVDFVFEFKVHS